MEEGGIKFVAQGEFKEKHYTIQQDNPDGNEGKRPGWIAVSYRYNFIMNSRNIEPDDWATTAQCAQAPCNKGSFCRGIPSV